MSRMQGVQCINLGINGCMPIEFPIVFCGFNVIPITIEEFNVYEFIFVVDRICVYVWPLCEASYPLGSKDDSRG